MNAAKSTPSLAISMTTPHHAAGGPVRRTMTRVTAGVPVAAVVRGTSAILRPPAMSSVISRLLRLLRMPAEERDDAADRHHPGDAVLVQHEHEEDEEQ